MVEGKGELKWLREKAKKGFLKMEDVNKREGAKRKRLKTYRERMTEQITVSYTHSSYLTSTLFFLTLPPYFGGGKKIQSPDGILPMSLRLVL